MNVCTNRELQISLNNILNLRKITLSSADFSSNLVEQILETKRTKCICCDSALTRKFKYKKSKKGSIGCKYDNKVGPILTVHYMHECSSDECAAVYYHNKYIM